MPASVCPNVCVVAPRPWFDNSASNCLPISQASHAAPRTLDDWRETAASVLAKTLRNPHERARLAQRKWMKPVPRRLQSAAGGTIVTYQTYSPTSNVVSLSVTELGSRKSLNCVMIPDNRSAHS